MKGEKEEEARVCQTHTIEWHKIASVFVHDLMPPQYKLQIFL